jgi:hypothetical protein
MKSLFKPLCVIALLLCNLAQAAALPPRSDAASCSHHSAMPHAPCCESGSCDCLQVPALSGIALQAISLLASTEPISNPSTGSTPILAGKFFRPPI